MLFAKTDTKAFMHETGNPDSSYVHPVGRKASDKGIGSLETVMMKRIKITLQNKVKTFEKDVSRVLHTLFLGPVICPYTAFVLQVEQDSIIWERFFLTDKENTFFTSDAIDELRNNFHVYRPDQDNLLTLSSDSDLNKSFFKTRTPESSFVFKKDVKSFGPLLMLLLETVARAWKGVGHTICVPLDVLRKGPAAAKEYAIDLLKKKYDSLAPEDEDIRAHTFFEEDAGHTSAEGSESSEGDSQDNQDPGYLVVNPQIICCILLKIKAWFYGKSLKQFVRDDYVATTGKGARLSFTESETVQKAQEEMVAWLIRNWMAFRVAFVAHFVAKAKILQENDSSKKMWSGIGEEAEESGRVADGKSDEEEVSASGKEIPAPATPNYAGERDWLKIVGSAFVSQPMTKTLKKNEKCNYKLCKEAPSKKFPNCRFLNCPNGVHEVCCKRYLNFFAVHYCHVF